MGSEVSMAIMTALKKGSVAENGVPMIDEEGRPRPFRADVVIAVSVEGNGNRVGSSFAAEQGGNGMGEEKKGSEKGEQDGERGTKRMRRE